jgi:molybdopterin molybdotransferase
VLNNQLVFGLPGNPGSAFTCFYEYVYPAIQQLQNSKYPFLKKLYLPLSGSFTKKSGLTHFLKGKLFDRGVMIMSHQESYKMNSFAESDCLIQIPEETENIIDGELVEVHLLPM